MLAFLLLLAPAVAPPAAAAPPEEHVIGNPDWMRKPTADQVGSAFPVKAMAAGLDGRVTLRCRVFRTGALEGCRVTSEAPAGVGFAQAALVLSQYFQMKPRTLDGKPVEDGVVTIPIRFNAGGGGGGAGYDRTARQISTPVWTAAPTRADLVAVYPARALQTKASGRAALRCEVAGKGGLVGCELMQEEPRGYGFGGAAARLASRFRVADPPGGVSPTGAYVTYNVAFTPELAEAEAQRRPPTPPHSPEWASAPTAEEASATFPALARTSGVLKGAARVRCTVKADGWLSDCAPVSETPEGLGFGAAAAGLATRLRMSLWTAAGSPTAGAQLVMPLAYDLTDGEAAPARR